MVYHPLNATRQPNISIYLPPLILLRKLNPGTKSSVTKRLRKDCDRLDRLTMLPLLPEENERDGDAGGCCLCGGRRGFGASQTDPLLAEKWLWWPMVMMRSHIVTRLETTNDQQTTSTGRVEFGPYPPPRAGALHQRRFQFGRKRSNRWTLPRTPSCKSSKQQQLRFVESVEILYFRRSMARPAFDVSNRRQRKWKTFP